MSAKEKVISGFMCFGLSRYGAETLFADVLEAVKEEITPKDQTFQEFFGLDEKPQLIQGYTAENWQEIIDGGYLCEFWGGSYTENCEDKPLGKLTEASDGEGDYFLISGGDLWTYCRPAQIKGVMRPIFVEPVDPAMAGCVFFGASGVALHSGDSWGYNYVKHNNKFPKATKYIEL